MYQHKLNELTNQPKSHLIHSQNQLNQPTNTPPHTPSIQGGYADEQEAEAKRLAAKPAFVGSGKRLDGRVSESRVNTINQ